MNPNLKPTTIWDIQDRAVVNMPVSQGSSTAARELAIRNMPHADRERWYRAVETLNVLDVLVTYASQGQPYLRLK